MYRGQSQMNGWNIFARELQNVLRQYNLSISQLSDRVGIQSEKVSRLTQSLSTPNIFPVLDVDEMELLKNTLNLPESDIIHLRAALITTSIEKTLMETISQHDARDAANRVFSIIRDSLEESSEGTRDLGNARGDVGAQDDDGPDRAFASVKESVDEGDRTMEMSDAISNPKRKKQYAQSARDAYEDALQQLDQLNRDLKRLPVWKNLQKAALQGKQTAERRLADR